MLGVIEGVGVGEAPGVPLTVGLTLMLGVGETGKHSGI